ncbi:C6 transcription factor [Colletotrichum plurivorum]|uniref:C6 transcription factor n=1 Tax=Colletotrichum plurivorum TaxID=2175906 RepID=A0A8H6MW89_9PEZI|nr:C6 transcription factor [Colletotrichum plurivorum]
MQSAAETDSSLPRNARRRETSTELTSTAAPDPVADAVPSNTQFTSPSTAVGTTPDLGLYQSSFKTQEQAGHSQGTPFGLDPSLRAIAESRLKPIQLVTTIPPIQPRPYQGNTSTPPEGKTKLSVASLALQNPFSSKNPTLFDETQLFWKRYLLSLLPTQTQADLLVTYFFENINWIYHAVHAPSFRARYSELWATDVEDVDLIWLALLYVMFSLSSLYISAPMAEAAGFEVADLAVLSHRWYCASRQALKSGGYESKPVLVQLQVFIVTQIYWYGTKDIETLNSHLGQAIRNAQAMGLDKESPESITDCLEREIRHRVWWDLAGADTFQSLCLGRPPLLQSHMSNVPFPSNCNDVDITSTAAHIRPLSEPTEMSMHHFRGRIFKVLNKLWIDNGANLGSHAFVSAIDEELAAVTDEFPWYFRNPAENMASTQGSNGTATLPPNFGFVLWGHHLLDSCIAVQRVRMYRPFLRPRAGEMFRRCVAAGSSTLTLYRAIRSRDEARFQRSDKLRIQAYHVISAAIVLATFLLVEQPADAASIRADIEMVAADLQPSAPGTTDDKRSIATIVDGLRVLRRILLLLDERAYNLPQGGDHPVRLAPEISSVFGGEAPARKYLERCAIKYLGCDDGTLSQSDQAMCDAGAFDASSWEALLDPSAWGEWGDEFWSELGLAVGPGTGGM